MTDQVNTRALVLELLLEVTSGKEYSHVAVRGILEKYQYLGKQDRAFLTRVAEGTIERMLELDYIINQFSKVPVNRMKPVIRNILRMSVYQIKYMDRIPDSAVCNEAVKLAQKKGFANLKGFVNGVLRNIARGLSDIQYPDLSVRYSTPKWIVEQWTEEYGAETACRMLEDQYREKPVTIRVNLQKITKEQLKKRLESEGVCVQEPKEVDCALAISDYDYLRAIPSFREGLFQVQDVSSMMAALMAEPKEGDYCMDVCAAPGGKSLHLADLMKGTGMVEARDLTDYKVGLIQENIERSGVANMKAVRMDATVPDEASVEKADILIADLPCSGLGVLNKKSDLKYRMSREQQEELVALQRRILDTVWQYVKPGGTLIYSTCTVHKEENEGNARWFAENYPFTLKDQVQMLPGIDPWDGFYIAKLERKPHD
ncbi:MAG: 16S rRNA (cytosine(967)-C(5))-methyltransferase RsmB [Clostridiales bacterium]|nr:16S rRNA (cytosine(967)-C(5))-methyltransferase RsmB [Clostridiales bacterium]